MRPLATLCSILPTLLSAQSDFAPVGAQWTYDQMGGTYTMTVVGDTVLSGHTCSIIEGSSPSACWQSQAYTYQSGDTVFWSDDQYLPQFFELYRWNAQPGESWDVWTNGPVTVTYSVLGTGTTTVNGQTLRTLNVEAIDTQMAWAQSSGVLIENIGDTLFMFPWLAAFCDAMVPWPLRCYSDSALGTFMRPGVTDCTPPPPSTVFAPVGAMWTYTQRFAWGPDSALFNLTCTGDTLILGRSCSIIQGGVTDCYFPWVNGTAYIHSSGDSIFLFEPGDQSFDLLYAFNAVAGDTWDFQRYIAGPLDSVHFEVIATSTTVIDGMPLRVLDVEQTVVYDGVGPMWPMPIRIIERLGNLTYHFLWGSEACDMDILGPLRCYEDPGITWLNPQFPQCELSVGIAEQHTTPLLTALPTLAATGEPIHLTCDRGLIELFDAAGRTMLERTTSGFTTLELERPGTYLLRFTSRNGEVAHEWIVVY